MKRTIWINGFKKTIATDDSVRIIDALRITGDDIPSDCGGRGKCGKCRIRILNTDFDPPVSEAEERLLTSAELQSGFRLACRQALKEEIRLEIPRSVPGVETYKRLGIGTGHPFEVKPFVVWRKKSAGGNYGSDNIVDEKAGRGTAKRSDNAGRQSMGEASQRGAETGKKLYALTTAAGAVIAESNRRRPLMGVAIDLGTTTIAVYLGDLQTGQIRGIETAMNPQAKFGTDVMSRISAARYPEAAKKMQKSVRRTLSDCVRKLTQKNKLRPDDLVDGIVVGNPTMLHLLLGYPVESLGRQPYQPVFKSTRSVESSLLGLPMLSGAMVHTLPLCSGFIGADALAAWLYAEDLLDGRSTLLMDLGTNGEMILSVADRLLATSCATGPAFEGAELQCGMTAQPGAVDKLRFVDGQAVLSVIGATDQHPVEPVGICGSGAVSVLAQMLKNGLVLPDGRFANEPGSPLIQLETGGQAYVLHTTDSRRIVFSQKDIRALQLAKGALATGFTFLFKAARIEIPERIFIAGAFGNFIDPEEAMRLGMIPKLPMTQIEFIGNAAGLGACKALFSTRARQRVDVDYQKVEVIEMGNSPEFQDLFVKNLTLSTDGPARTHHGET